MGTRSLRAVLCLAALPLAGSCSESQPYRCVPVASFPAGIELGPQLAQAAPTAMTIAWRSTAEVVGGIEVEDASGPVASRTGTAPGREHLFRIEGLAPSATYDYRLRHDGAVVAGPYAFRTAPADPQEPFRFAVTADSGTGCAQQLAVAALLESLDPAFVLLAGDVAYPRGTAADFRDGYFVPFADLIARAPFYPVPGNHDVASAGGAAFRDLLHLPDNGGSRPEHWYAFDWGPCHVVGLDSNLDLGPGSEQHAWLDADLAAREATWTIVFLHHGPYGSSRYGGDADLRRDLVPLFDASGVDLVFSGHEHDYERTLPLRGGEVVDASPGPDYVDPPGTVYVVTGGGGQRLYPAGQSGFTAFSVSAWHAVRVEVDGDTLEIAAVGLDGVLLDRARITRTSRP